MKSTLNKKVLIKETNEIGTVIETTVTGAPKLIKVGEKIIEAKGKAIVILTTIQLFITRLLKILNAI